MSARETLPPALATERAADKRARAAELVGALRMHYPDSRCALDHESPFQLLISVILSAQCTDERVNQVAVGLYERFPDAASMAGASLEELEHLVQPTGFFRQKAKNILAAAQRIVDVYGGEVPRTIEELTTLPGAARKTANVVISVCFPEDAAGIAVDTHVQRIARRLRLTTEWEPVKMERQLMRELPKDAWNDITLLLIDHGRAVCKAPTPKCGECPLAIAERCPSRDRWASAPPRRTARTRRAPGHAGSSAT